MFRKLFDNLKIPEFEVLRVGPLLTTLFQWAQWVVGVSGAFALIIVWMGFADWRWFLSVVLLFGITILLRTLNDRGYVDLAVNAFLAAITLYAVLAEPLGFPEPRLHTLLYAAPVVIAAFLLPSISIIMWGALVAGAVLLRSLVTWFAGMQSDYFLAFVVSLPGLSAITILLWRASQSFQKAQEDLLLQVRQGQAGIEIGHTVSSALDPPSVIRQAVRLIYDAFGYYQVALFLVDQEQGLAVLADAAGSYSNLKDQGFHVSLTGTSAVAAASAGCETPPDATEPVMKRSDAKRPRRRRGTTTDDPCPYCQRTPGFLWQCLGCDFKICQDCMTANFELFSCNGITWWCADCGKSNGF